MTFWAVTLYPGGAYFLLVSTYPLLVLSITKHMRTIIASKRIFVASRIFGVAPTSPTYHSQLVNLIAGEVLMLFVFWPRL